MKKIFFALFAYCITFQNAFAQVPLEENILWIDDDKLKAGNVDIDTIPQVLANVINLIIGFAGTISVFMLIFFAVKMQLNSGITGDSSGVDRARKWMIASGIGFVLSVSAWFIMDRVIDILQIAT